MKARVGACIALLVCSVSSGCFAEVSAGAYRLDHAEVSSKNATQIGVAFGFYYDMGTTRAAVGVGGDIVQADGYEDSDGTGEIAHGIGPYYGRVDVALLPLWWLFTLDVTAGVFGGTGPAVVIYDQMASPDDCTSGCGPAVGFEDGKPKVGHAGPSVGGYVGPSVSLAAQGPGELRLTVAASVLHTDIAPRDPLTAYGVQVRLAYGWTRFGSKDADFSTMWAGYSNDLDADIRRFGRKRAEYEQRRRETEQREKREREQERQRRRQGL